MYFQRLIGFSFGRNVAAILVGGLIVSSCATQTERTAAPEIVAFLTAISRGDETGVAEGMDLPALQAQVSGVAQKVVSEEFTQSGSLVGRILSRVSPILVDRAVGQALEPKSIIELATKRGVRERLGRLGPNAVAIGLQTLPNGQLCLPDGVNGSCSFKFSQSNGSWKLVALEEAWLERRLKVQIEERRGNSGTKNPEPWPSETKTPQRPSDIRTPSQWPSGR